MSRAIRPEALPASAAIKQRNPVKHIAAVARLLASKAPGSPER
jgi:hypothetical protein